MHEPFLASKGHAAMHRVLASKGRAAMQQSILLEPCCQKAPGEQRQKQALVPATHGWWSTGSHHVYTTIQSAVDTW